MTVALSILFAAFAGGIVFLLIDRSQRDAAPSAPAREPERWAPPTATRPASTSLFVPPSAHAPVREHFEERTEPLPPSRGLWDDPPRRDDEDDDDRPPGLWSGWAR